MSNSESINNVMKPFSSKAIYLMSTSASLHAFSCSLYIKKNWGINEMFSGSDLGKHLGQNSQNIWSVCLHQSCHYRLTAVINRNSLWTMNDIVSGFSPFIHFSYISNQALAMNVPVQCLYPSCLNKSGYVPGWSVLPVDRESTEQQ